MRDPWRPPSECHAFPDRGIPGALPHPIRGWRVATVPSVEIGPAVIPLITALIAAGLAARVGGSAVRRFRPAKALWALGLLMFAVAAAAEAYGAADGWGP